MEALATIAAIVVVVVLVVVLVVVARALAPSQPDGPRNDHEYDRE